MIFILALLTGAVVAVSGMEARNPDGKRRVRRTALRQTALTIHDKGLRLGLHNSAIAHDNTRFAAKGDDDEPDIVSSIDDNDLEAEVVKDIESQAVVITDDDEAAARRLADTSSSGSSHNDVLEASDLSLVSAAEVDTANALHLSCGVMLTYVYSDVKYYKEKVLQGVTVFVKVIGSLIKSAGDIFFAIAMAIKRGTFDRLMRAVSNELPSPDSVHAFQNALAAPDKESFWSKFKTFVKKLATFKNLCKFLDFAWQVITNTFFPAAFDTVRKVAQVSAWVVGQLVPASLSKAQSRCLACMLGMPSHLQTALVMDPFTSTLHPSVCGISTSGTGTKMLAHKDASLDFSEDLREFAIVAASSGKMADIKMALHVAGNMLKSPFSTIRSAATPELRKELKASFALPSKRLSMASAYIAAATPSIVNDYLDKFIDEVKSGSSLYERSRVPWVYMAAPWRSTDETPDNRKAFAHELKRLKAHTGPVKTMFMTGIEDAA